MQIDSTPAQSVPAPVRTAIGSISGTSMDGIDVALIQTDGDKLVRPGAGRTYAYAPALRSALLKLLDNPAVAQIDPLSALELEVTDAHAGAIQNFMAEQGLSRDQVDLIGLHGQTVYHRPEVRFTRQLGLGQRVADTLGVPVVNRFRHADVAAGGEGAPFAPLYHRALAASLPASAHPLMLLNLGGVGNLSYIDGEAVIAFDTGPASALLDDFMQRRRGLPFDEGGQLAATGKSRRSGAGGADGQPLLQAARAEVFGPQRLSWQGAHGQASVRRRWRGHLGGLHGRIGGRGAGPCAQRT